MPTGGAGPLFCKYTKMIFLREGESQESFEFLRSTDAGSCYLLDVPERDALPEQRDFLLVLVFVGLVALAVGRRSSHLDPFPAASGYVLVPAGLHPLLDGEPLHAGDFEQDGAD